MIGDSLSDVIAGKNAEVSTIYIGQSKPNPFVNADQVFNSLLETKDFFEDIVTNNAASV